MKTLRDRLSVAMNEAGIPSQRQLAQIIGIRPATITRWVQEETKVIRKNDLEAAAKALGVTPRWLLNGEEPKHPSLVADRVIPYRVEPPPIDTEILTQALDLVLQELLRRKATLPPSKIAAAVVEIYTLVTTQGKREVEVGNVTPFVNLLLAR